jgi:hypothetical protein
MEGKINQKDFISNDPYEQYVLSKALTDEEQISPFKEIERHHNKEHLKNLLYEILKKYPECFVRLIPDNLSIGIRDLCVYVYISIYCDDYHKIMKNIWDILIEHGYSCDPFDIVCNSLCKGDKDPVLNKRMYSYEFRMSRYAG